MKLQATIDQLWADLLSGDIRSIIKHFAHDCSISLPANKSNNVIPFVGDYTGHDGVENFFKLRAETLTPTSSSIESIHHEKGVVFLNVRSAGKVQSSGHDFTVDDIHILQFNSVEHINKWTIYGDMSELIDALKSEHPQKLLLAVAANDADAVATLLQQGADPNVRNKETGLTALMMAACQAQSKIVRLLLDAGADVYTTDSNTGATAHTKLARVKVLKLQKCLLIPDHS